jgi:LmbE family N-acetylglucosaminyl deacetylase
MMNEEKRYELFCPFNGNRQKTLTSTTHLAIAAHQDDVEIMAQHGILACFGQKDKNFSAVIVTDGAGSPRSGLYADYTDDEMKRIRATEQKKAAIIGDYSALVLLNFPSKIVKDPQERAVIDSIKEILLETKPRVIYTHNPADKHETHVATSVRVIVALQEIVSIYQPELLLGCEVWRGLDWVNDSDKKVLDVSDHPALKASLLGVFDSQIEGGKRYDLASLGRNVANATFYASHQTDEMSAAIYAIDLTPLLHGGDIAQYIKAYIDRFSRDVVELIHQVQVEKK